VASQGVEDGKEDSTSETLSAGSNEKERFAAIRNNAMFGRLWDIITWTPKRCRWDPENPPHFSTALNVLFGFVSGDFYSSLFDLGPLRITRIWNTHTKLFRQYASNVKCVFWTNFISNAMADSELMNDSLQPSPWPIYTTTSQFSTSSRKSSMSHMNASPSSRLSCKPAMRAVFCSSVPWETSCAGAP
jgi:hypothetical protein